MNLNLKITILIILTLGLFFVGFISNASIKDVENEKKSFFKLSNELHIIKNITEYYGKTTKNKRKINRIISFYEKRIIFKKEEKSSIEFKVSKLNKDELNRLSKDILNGGFKISNFKVLRIDNNKAEITCKVLF